MSIGVSQTIGLYNWLWLYFVGSLLLHIVWSCCKNDGLLRFSNMICFARENALVVHFLIGLVFRSIGFNEHQGCHTGRLDAFCKVYRAGGQVVLSIMPYINRVGYFRQRNYCSKFTLLQ